MYSLFSSFDYILWLNYKRFIFIAIIIIFFIIFIFINLKKWLIIRIGEYLKSIILYDVKNLSNNSVKMFNGFIIVIFNVLILIIFINLIGILPYIFPFTSHIEISITISIILWITLTNKGGDIRIEKVIKHLVPANLPTAIRIFLFIVEIISHQIRPLTISFRLRANITAGHIIFRMLNSTITFLFWGLSLITINYWFVILLSSFYIIFEFWIIIIQRIVFTLLIFLYIEDYII